MPSTSGKVFFCLCALLAAPGARTFAQTPAPPAQPPAQTPAPSKPPAKEGAAEERWDTSDGQFSVAVTGWYNPSRPIMRSGKDHPFGYNPSDLDYPGKNQATPGAVVSVGLGKDHTLRFSYFRTLGGDGSLTAPQALTFFGTSYDKGDKLSVGSTLQNGKISLDYLSWPFPVKNARFRLKTLWEVQYTGIKTTIHAPDKEAADASLTPAVKTNWFIFPTFGIGVEYLISKHFRWQARGSGFGLPHRSYIWDAETTFAYRAGPIEFFFGGKGFSYKTSPQGEEYVRDRLVGAVAGLRWYP